MPNRRLNKSFQEANKQTHSSTSQTNESEQQEVPSVDSQGLLRRTGIHSQLLNSRNVMQLQAQIGNQNTRRLLAKSERKASSRAQNQNSVQRDFDFQVDQAPLLQSALLNFHQTEQQDLTQEEFDKLKTEHQRFMPLLGRFATARNTTLVIKPAPKSITGDLAITRLVLVPQDGEPIVYDDKKSEFKAAIEKRNVSKFKVQVLFWVTMVRNTQPSTDPTLLNSEGAILQAFTHEMTVHAENMLDYIEQYWKYHDGEVDVPPGDLPTSSEEHSQFKKGEVSRYEYMKERLTSNEGIVSQGFKFRESSDKLTAH